MERFSQNPSSGFWTGQSGLGHIGVEVEPAEPRHPGALRIMAYWESKRPGGTGIPPWRSIVPGEIVPLLPSLLLAEPAGDDWRYRLHGTRLVSRCGVEWTNRYVREVYEPASADACNRLYRAITRRRSPLHVRGRYLGLGIEHATVEAVHFPVIGRDDRTIWIFGGVFFLNEVFRGLSSDLSSGA